MNNTTILFGFEVDERLQADKKSRVPESHEHEGCFESEPLCRWQCEMHSRGFLRIELIKSVYGWYLRNASGLDGFSILAGTRSGQVDGTLKDALRWARTWFESAPTKRIVFTRDPLPGTGFVANLGAGRWAWYPGQDQGGVAQYFGSEAEARVYMHKRSLQCVGGAS